MTKTYRVRTDQKFEFSRKNNGLSYIWQRSPRPDGGKGLNPHKTFATRVEAQEFADTCNAGCRLAWGDKSPYHYIVVEGPGEGFPPLTREQTTALIAFIVGASRYWKRCLRKAWENGRASGELQRLRNTHGPAWLKTYTLDDGAAS